MKTAIAFSENHIRIRVVWRAALALLAAVFLGGCYHYVKVDITVPANKTLPGVRELAVGTFANKTDLAREMNLGASIAPQIVEGINAEKFVTAHMLDASNAESDADAIKRAPEGVHAVLLGTVADASSVDSPPLVVMMPVWNQQTQTMDQVQMMKVSRSAKLALEYRVLRTEDGSPVCADSMSDARAVENTAQNADLARAGLPAPANMIQSMLPPMIRRFVTDLTPTTVQEKRRLFREDGEVKLGVKSADNGLWDEAQAYWEEAINTADSSQEMKPSKKARIKAAALYNLAVYYEAHNDFDRAKEKLNEARAQRPDVSWFSKYAGVVNKRATQFRRVEEQREAMDKRPN